MIIIDTWWKRLLVSIITISLLTELVEIIFKIDVGLVSFVAVIIVYLIMSVIYGVVQNK